MRSVLLIVLAMAFYASVNCEESATSVVKASEPIKASVRGGDRHEDQDRNYKILVKKVDLLRTSLLTHQRQLTESQQQSKMLQDQLQSEKAIVAQLKQQVSKLVDENVKNGVKHQAQDKDYANLLVAIGQLQSNLTTHEQQLETSQQHTTTLQSLLESENSTLVQLQQQVLDLNTASVKSDQKHQTQDMDYANQLLEIQQIKLNLASNQQQLNDSNLQTTQLQAQLQNKSTTIEQLQRQVSDLTAANVTATQQIQQLTFNLSSNQQQLQESKVLTTSLQAQLDNKTATINLLQSRVSDLIVANVTANQQIQQLNSTVTSQQNQLSVLQQKPAVQWVKWSANDTIPKDAVYAGQNSDSSPVYVGRVLYDGYYCVVKVCPTLRNGFFSFFGGELTTSSCEVLTGSDFYWQWGFNGNVPNNAISAGKAGSYVGRAHVSSSLNPGTIDVGNQAIFIGYSGKEYRFDAYQALCHD